MESQLCGEGMKGECSQRKKKQEQAEHGGRGREVVGSCRILRSQLNTAEGRSTRKSGEKTPAPEHQSRCDRCDGLLHTSQRTVWEIRLLGHSEF